MPRKAVRPFIARGEGTSFSVVHRAHSDPLYYDENASKMVLLAASAVQSAPEFHGTALRSSIASSYEPREGGEGGDNDDGSRSQASRVSRAASLASRAASIRSRVTGMAGGTIAGGGGGGGGGGSGSVRTGISLRSTRSVGVPVARRIGGKVELSEVDEMGLPLDGYDYSSHLAVVGGGVFVSARKGGSVTSGGAASLASIGGGGGGGGGARSVARSVRSAREERSSDDRNEAMLEGVLDTHDAAAALDLPIDMLPTLPEDAAGGTDVVTLREETLPIDLRELLDALDEGTDEDVDEEEEAIVAAARPIVLGGRAVEVLDDNFVLQAMGAEEIPDWADGIDLTPSVGAPSVAFDFDAHVARLMALAEGQYGDDDDDGLSFDDVEEGEEGEEEEGEDEGDEGDEGDDDDDDNEDGDIETAKLERLLQSYGDEEIGELDPEDPRIVADGFGFAKKLPTSMSLPGIEHARGAGPIFVLPGDASEGMLSRLADDFLAARDSTPAADFRNAAIEAITAIKERATLENRETRERERRRALLINKGEGQESVKDEDEVESEEDIDDDETEPADVTTTRLLPESTTISPPQIIPSAPPPPPPPSAAFKINIGSLKLGGARITTTAVSSATPPSAALPLPPPPPPRSPSPVSSAAALAAASATALASARAAARPVVIPLVSSSSSVTPMYDTTTIASSEIPFGWAEGDLDEVSALIPPTWGRRVGRGHDVETVLSTRSSTAHHPRVLIDRPSSVVSASASAAPRMLGGGGALLGSSNDSDVGSIVRVSKKTGLPVNVVLDIDARSGTVRIAPAPVSHAPKRLDDDGEDGILAEASDEEASVDEGESEEEDGLLTNNDRLPGDARPQNESADQRRVRKAAIRSIRADRRATKKETSRIFKREEIRHVTADANKDPLAKGIALGNVH
jgi:hypothetical protein